MALYVENVAEQVKPPRVRRRKPTVWTSVLMRKFLMHISTDRFYALYLLTATTGLRRVEVRAPLVGARPRPGNPDGGARYFG
jgi:hypothetical protein